MKHIFATLLLLFSVTLSVFSNFSANDAVEKKENNMTIFLFNNLSGKKLTYSSLATRSTPIVTKHALDGTTSQVSPSDIIDNGGSYDIINLQDGYGYSIGSNMAWIINYSAHLPTISSLSATNDDENCSGRVTLHVDKSEPDLQYRTLSDNIHTLSHEYNIEYDNIEWDNESKTYVDITTEHKNIKVGSEYDINNKIPLKQTAIILQNAFAKQLDITVSQASTEINPIFVTRNVTVTVLRDGMDTDSTFIDGDTYTAPYELRFTAHANEPIANFFRWRVYRNDSENWDYQINDREFTHTFTQAGKYKITLDVANQANASCIDKGYKVEFQISESMLELPNFFSPVGSPGKNDIYKVKHKSLVKFKATIFNRWGNKIYEWNNPDEGWDGTYKGKHVNPGVYFVIVDATGSEGRRYKKSSDINILHGK